MKLFTTFLCLVLSSRVFAQTTDTLTIVFSESKGDSTTYRRFIQYDSSSHLFHVTDTYLSGQVAMEGDYLSIAPNVKEEFWNYHHTHIKHGFFRKWFDNGRLEWEGQFANGVIEGRVSSWYQNGQRHFTGQYDHGMQYGLFTYWNEDGTLNYRADFESGVTIQPRKARYDYLTYLPKGYDTDLDTRWPTIIFLHGGSSRGSDLTKVKANGIPDQLERGKSIPFIVIAPQCPVDKRWETDDWFDTLFAEITSRYQVDTNRVYLTGLSLGASGTWYLAITHPSTFAAIAPIRGKSSYMQLMVDSVRNLAGIPIWIFHGLADEIVDVNESLQMAKRLEHCGVKYRLSVFDGHKHWQTPWEVYGSDEVYSWFLQWKKQ
jgi:pimeloyl-ACP methyl ester carboxylesterase